MWFAVSPSRLDQFNIDLKITWYDQTLSEHRDQTLFHTLIRDGLDIFFFIAFQTQKKNLDGVHN